MSNDTNVTGQISTNIGLTLNSSSLSSGHWGPNFPVNNISVGAVNVNAFYAAGAKATATGTEGTVVYSAPDGTIFTLYFSASYSGTNQCTIGTTGTFPSQYTCTVTYSQSASFIANYSIDHN